MDDLDLYLFDVECSIYGATRLGNKILTITSDCKVCCISFNKFKPQISEIEFAYIPNGAKIRSISILERSPNDEVIGITHSKNTIYYLNLYASQANLDLEHIAQGCQTIRLRYVPYHLFPCETLTSDGRSLKCWLLSGGDCCIHLFIENTISQNFEEKCIDDHFPELSGTFECPALWIDFKAFKGFELEERIVALGFEDGTVRLFHSAFSRETKKYTLIRKSLFEEYNTIIPCVRLFDIHSVKESCQVRQKIVGENPRSAKTKRPTYNLLLVSSTNPCIIFKDILNEGFDLKQILPESRRIDCNTTAAVGDIDFDGRNEILIGNHGKEILTYKYNGTEYELCNIKRVNNPIYSLLVFDITGDALNDVCVLLSNGILIMQSSVKDAVKTFENRIASILSRLQ